MVLWWCSGLKHSSAPQNTGFHQNYRNQSTQYSLSSSHRTMNSMSSTFTMKTCIIDLFSLVLKIHYTEKMIYEYENNI